MRRSRVLHGLGILAAGGLFAACASISGLSDLNFDQGGAGGATTSSTTSASSTTTTTTSTMASTTSASNASSSAATATAAVTTSATASSSTGSNTEDCTNGTDDNGDGEVDCADAQCGNQGFECHTLPSGWIGPVSLFMGPTGTEPACPNDYSVPVYTGYDDLANDPAQCDACTCAPQFGCAPAKLESYGAASCMPAMVDGGAGFDLIDQGPAGTCKPYPSTNYQSFDASSPTLDTSPGCDANGGTATLPSPDWATTAVVCAPAMNGGGCNGAGKTCFAPLPQAPFETTWCVLQSGDHACPQFFPVQYQFYDGAVDDTRDCTGCSCGNGTGSCTASTTLYSDGNCANKVTTVTNDGNCAMGTGAAPKALKVDVKTTASCPPSGGAPIGSLQPDGNAITTICCK